MRAHRFLTSLCLCAVTAQPFLATAGAQDWLVRETSVQRLARQIDKLEQHLDCYGTVVPKAPDVWGQARLTKYRVEYEKVLEQQKEKFEVTLNAAISRSDQAFLASSLALQAAISGNAAVQSQPMIRTKEVKTPVPVYNPAGQLVYDQFGNVVTGTRSEVVGFEESEQFSPLSIPTPPAPPTFVNPQFAGTAILREKEILGFGTGDVAIEPTLKLDQMSRYVNHLHELRRINDGDDKADAPGYALHLVRIPVSVLPGKQTSEGYGAEITVTAKPHLHDQLLPITFKGLVINDLVDHFAFPLAKFLDSPDREKVLAAFEAEARFDAAVPSDRRETVRTLTASLISGVEAANRLLALDGRPTPDPELDKFFKIITAAAQELLAQLLENNEFQIGVRQDLLQLLASVSQYGKASADFQKAKRAAEQGASPSVKSSSTRLDDPAVMQAAEDVSIATRKFHTSATNLATRAPEITIRSLNLDELKQVVESQLIIPTVAITPSRRSTLPFPTSQAFDVYGGAELGRIALLARGLTHDPLQNKGILLLDMQKLLAEEFNSAYEYLKLNDPLWIHCTQSLATAIRRHDTNTITCLRQAFMSDPAHPTAGVGFDQVHASNSVQALAWAIIVESALLNERLVQDMAEIAAAKNNYCVNTQWLPYFHPNPCPEAVASFNAYVECRWPIHVVAVEPVTDDQNVADMFSQTRELQLALSIAFATGQIGAQSFTRMAQKLSLDMETIALNRTMVAFSHGDDTFGWRFYPRVQSPDTESPCRATMRTLFTGGPTRDYLLKQRRLEPGVRECTAVVIMPSFVPYVVFDTRCNWFKLTNPTKKELDVRAGVDLSKDITDLRCLTQECVRDAHRYRSNETHRLTRTVDQLESRLPLQTVFAQMPFENTLGGFEFFNSGVPDLAPELKGFYGEPGVLIGDGKVSTLFFVGDHFSVHETKVVVGNRLCNAELLSRQVMRVFVPGDVNTVGETVDAHVATPYGVSNHITVPVIKPAVVQAAASVPAADSFAWTVKPGETIPVQVCLEGHLLSQGLCVQGTPTIKHENQGPFTKMDTAEFAAVVTINPGKDVKPLKEPMKVQGLIKFQNGAFPFRALPSSTCNAEFEKALLACLQVNHVSGLKDGDLIVLEGYLRGAVDPNGPTQIFRLTNVLPLQVTVVRPPVAPVVAPCAPPSQVEFRPETLFGLPVESTASVEALRPVPAAAVDPGPRQAVLPDLPAPPIRR